ncbi:MAG: tetratricopeptide repeat protein [Syntrophales bacterium]
MFDEEQYAVLTLARFWEEVAVILSEQDDSFAWFSEKIDALYDLDNTDEEIYKLLSGALGKQGKKLVLLLDNFGDMIKKFSKKDIQRLREVLLTSNCLRLIGASSVIMESFYRYDEPLFDFFKVIKLNELDREETITLLQRLGENHHTEKINKIIKEQPERIDALRKLTGGVPRTIILLFEIFVDDIDGNSFKDLEMTLDRVTPLYKHRLDNLSNQQQAIIDAIAQAWDAVSVKEIAKKTRMESKAVSAQLNELQKSQIIQKISTSTKNHLYQIRERFFNIYYLMRLGRRKNRNRVLWLVKFFEICCGETDLIERTRRHISAMREGRLYEKHAFYVAEALANCKIPLGIQHELVSEARNYLETKKSDFAKDLNKSHLEVWEEAARAGNVEAIRHLATFYYKSNEFSKAEIYCKMAIDKGDSEAMFNLALLYETEFKDFEKAEAYYKMAIDKGESGAMFNLALLYQTEFKDFKKAETYYKMAIDKGKSGAMLNLALLYQTEFKDFKKAETYYKMAIDKGESGAVLNLALLYQTEFKDFEKAEAYYKMAIDKGNAEAMNNLALLYQEEFKDFEKAEAYYKMAIDKGKSGAMFNLALLYKTEFKDFKSAETYYKMAIDKGDADAMNNLALLYYAKKKNKRRALVLVKKAYDIDKRVEIVGASIAILLWNDEVEEAINIYKESLDKEEIQKEVSPLINNILLRFIAKGQLNFVYNLFAENKFAIKDKYKPVYYALLVLMGDEYADEQKRMGSELKETVQEIIKQIKSLKSHMK